MKQIIICTLLLAVFLVLPVLGCTKRLVGPDGVTSQQSAKEFKSKEKPAFSQKELEIIINLDTLEKKWQQGFSSGLPKEQMSVYEDIHDIALDNMQLLRNTMQGSDLEIKMIATLALGFTGEQDVIGMLVAANYDSNPVIRTNSAFSLGLLGNKETPPESLLKLLQDEDPNVRNSAAYALSRILTKQSALSVLEPLHKALADEYPEVRREVIRALMATGNLASLPYVSNCLKDNDEFVRINAVLALGVFNDKKAIPTLITALEDAQPRVQDSAIYSLQQITGIRENVDVKSWQEWWGKNKSAVVTPSQDESK